MLDGHAPGNLVMQIFKGETSVAEGTLRNGVTVAEVEGWKEQFLRAAENGLRRPKDDEGALKNKQTKKTQTED